MPHAEIPARYARGNYLKTPGKQINIRTTPPVSYRKIVLSIIAFLAVIILVLSMIPIFSHAAEKTRSVSLLFRDIVNETALTGGSFALYDEVDEQGQPKGDSVSWLEPSTAGIDLGELPYDTKSGTNYYLFEIEAPDGYILPAGYLVLRLAPDGAPSFVWEGDDELYAESSTSDFDGCFYNYPRGEDYRLDFVKQDGESSDSLSGATFELYDSITSASKPAGRLIASSKSSDDGMVSMLGVPTKKGGELTYYLIESDAPEGYYRSSDYYALEIGIDVSGAVTKEILLLNGEGDNLLADRAQSQNERFAFPNYKPAPIDFTIKVLDEKSRDGLKNARFEVYETITDEGKPQGDFIFSGTSNSDGLLKVENLTASSQGESTFYLFEMQAPSAYYLPTDYYAITVTTEKSSMTAMSIVKNDGEVDLYQSGDINLSITNEKAATIELSFRKVDASDENLGLENGVFALYNDVDGSKPEGNLILTELSDSDGLFSFKNIPYAKDTVNTYYLFETVPPEGYAHTDDYYLIEIEAHDEKTDCRIYLNSEGDNLFKSSAAYLPIPNVKQGDSAPEVDKTTLLQLLKVDSADESKTLKGAKFELYDSINDKGEPDGTRLVSTHTGDGGVISLTDVPYVEGEVTKHYLFETVAPDGYHLPEDYYLLEIDSTKEELVHRLYLNSEGDDLCATSEKYPRIPNSLDTTVSLEFLKVDSRDEQIKLEGAEFVLYDEIDAAGNAVGEPHMRATSDSEGFLRFNNVPYEGGKIETYYLFETQAPEGYSLTSDYYLIMVDATPGRVDSVRVYRNGVGFDLFEADESGYALIKNTPAYLSSGMTTTLEFMNIDEETGAPLQGSEFVLYSDEGLEKPIDKITTEKEGIVSFDNVPYSDSQSTSYYLGETSQARGYHDIQGYFAITIGTKGEVTSIDFISESDEGAFEAPYTVRASSKNGAITNKVADASFVTVGDDSVPLAGSALGQGAAFLQGGYSRLLIVFGFMLIVILGATFYSNKYLKRQ